jgi:DNA-binding transcriptional regulator YiaG
MSDVDFSYKQGQKVLVVGEVMKSRVKAATADGAQLDYYVLKIEGSGSAVVVNSDAIRPFEKSVYKVRDQDFVENVDAMSRNIRRFRQASNMSQKEFGEALGVRAVTVSMWERGIRSPRAWRIPHLVKLLSISVEDLYGI